MDAPTITNLIGSLGFPIVTAGALFWYMVTEARETRKVIQNNTQVLAQLVEHVKEVNMPEDGK